jgi:Sulfotransferase family
VALVEITDVQDVDFSHAVLEGAHLDNPKAGFSSDLHALPVEGWAVGGSIGPVSAVELTTPLATYERTALTVTRPDVAQHLDTDRGLQSGFSTMVSTLGLGRDFELVVNAVVNDAWHPFAVIRGRTTYDRREPGGDPAPVLVIAHGRTGSTWLMRLLESHPAIVSYRPFEYELRVIAYWTKVALGLGSPRSFFQVLGARLSAERWWLGDGDSLGLVPDAALADALGREGVDAVIELARERVTTTYRALGDLLEKPGFTRFAEKFPPESPLIEAASWMYAGTKRVYLVRDPRDMALSINAYTARGGARDFGRERAESELDFLDGLAADLTGFFALWQHDIGADSVLIRYEDLIQEPDRELQRVFNVLGVDASDVAVAETLAAASSEVPQMREHRTAPDVKSSVERWRRDLSPAEQDQWTERFQEVLEAFGYETAASPDARRAR